MLFPNKRKYIGIGQNLLKNIGISDIGKNPISCIPSPVFLGMDHFGGPFLVSIIRNESVTLSVQGQFEGSGS